MRTKRFMRLPKPDNLGAAFTLQLITHLAQKSSYHGAVLLVTLAVTLTEE
jgi:hypothetical protein